MTNLTIKESALEYLARGWTIIPVGPHKKPLISWKAFQSERPTREQVENWWHDYPDANVGIVTGKVSGLTVIDIDTDSGKAAFAKLVDGDFKSPVVHTPKGGKHIYCQFHPFGNNCKAIEGIDLRSEGGYVVAPPSRTVNGGWEWDKESGLNVPLPPLPPRYIDAVIENVIVPGDKSYKVQPGRTFTDGQRNNDLYHVCLKWGKGGMDEEEMLEYALWIGKMTGLSRYEVERTMQSAVKMATRAERNLTQELKDWIRVTDGEFSVTDCLKSLDIITKSDRANIRQALHRFKKEGYIEKSGKKDGSYRRVNVELMPLDWKAAPTDEFNLRLPLGLNRLVSIFPKNIIIVSGLQNQGKTAFCLETAKLNMGNHPIVYFSSEMGDSELKVRLTKREDVKADDWKVDFFERSSHFQDVIRPEWVNIVDYLEVNDEFWKIGQILTDIHNRLTTGVAIISIQKNEKTDYGRGGTFSAEKPRLYLAMNPGEIKIVKAKNWKGIENPNGKIKNFRIIGGWKFLEDSDWHWPKKETKG